jgi:uncharacterized membrane protein YuzA (DUF378 family)
MKVLVFIAKLLVFVGAINWGLMGVTGFGEDAKPLNLVEKLTDPLVGDKTAGEADEATEFVSDAVGDVEVDEVVALSPGQNPVENVVYILVGVAALFLAWHHFCPCCKGGGKTEGACCEPAPKADACCGSPE